MFDWAGDQAKVKSWLKEGIDWRLGDAADPKLIRGLGLKDMVVANNFLCHMAPADAEKCLRNIGRLVRPGGCLFILGVDLDVRTKVALDLGWEPVTELMAEIHDGDHSVRTDWPWCWRGLEPLNRTRRDCRAASLNSLHVRCFKVLELNRADREFRVGFRHTSSPVPGGWEWVRRSDLPTRGIPPTRQYETSKGAQ